jgi:hypothetical protein
MPDEAIHPLIHARSVSPAPTFEARNNMDNLDLAGGSVRRKGRLSWVVALSYVFDWAILAAFAAIGYVLGDITPNMRPFSLDDRNIAYVDAPCASLQHAECNRVLTAR